MAKTDDDPIRELLASLHARRSSWATPRAPSSIMESKVVDAGGDPDEVLEWVRAHGGYPDKSFAVSTRRGRGPTLKPREAPKPYYVIPEDELK